MAHPVRPDSFVEINNFYTATIYEKGAEVIGMLKRLVGDAAYAKALDLYFERHDGEATTIEAWLTVFEDTTGRDLTQFKRWYEQAGTPKLSISEDYVDGTYTLYFSQMTPPTPGQPDKAPQVLPIAVGLLNADGREVQETVVLEMTQADQSFEFKGLDSKPVPSILREFSAPVILDTSALADNRVFLLANDTDPFNKWEAGQTLAKDLLVAMVTHGATPDQTYLQALVDVARDDTLDPAFRELALAMPVDDDIAQAIFEAGTAPDPDAIFTARETLKLSIAQALSDSFPRLLASCQIDAPYSPDADQVAKRSFSAMLLGYLSLLDGGKAAQAQFDAATNMTEQFTSLLCLLQIDKGTDAIARFYEQWQHDRLVIDKWFGVQIGAAHPDKAAAKADLLTKHPDFSVTNPNRFRATLGALAGNHAGFHHKSGKGYKLLADWLITLDPLNPQTTARMSAAFQTWKRYDAGRQALIKAQLERILATPDLSPDTTEMVGRILNG